MLVKCGTCEKEFNIFPYLVKRSTSGINYCSRACYEKSVEKEIKFEIDKNGCHICISHSKTNGYPMICRNNKYQLLSRYIYKEKYGAIPENFVVRHKCDNPSCINPEHLELGTQEENIKDKLKRNREARGERIGNSKLTEEQIKEIRQSKLSTYKLAKIYNVHPSGVSRIKNKKLWAHVE